MRNIIIVQCMSTGKNYVQDIIDRNCNPIVLEMKPFGDSEDALIYQEEVKREYEFIENDFDLIYEKDTYEETLEMVRKFDPVVIVPGTEDGVILATKLANDLNLLCNPIENIDAITLKNEMQNRLAKNKSAFNQGQVVRSLDEAIEYYDKENLKEVVVKPVYSAASVGVRLCSDRQEMIDAVKEVFNLTGVYGNELTELVIQERINGQEYVVDTVSCNGIHRVTLVWKYNKVKTSEGGNIYDYDITVNELGIGEAELVEYAVKISENIQEFFNEDRLSVLVSMVIEDMIVHIININENIDLIDMIIRDNGEYILISIKYSGECINVMEDEDMASNITILNKISEKIDYSQILGLNNIVIRIK